MAALQTGTHASRDDGSLTDLIEQAMRDTLLRELQPALADEAGRLLRERLQPAIERVLLAATSELRQSFDARLREAIARVVAAELARQRDRG